MMTTHAVAPPRDEPQVGHKHLAREGFVSPEKWEEAASFAPPLVESPSVPDRPQRGREFVSLRTRPAPPLLSGSILELSSTHPGRRTIDFFLSLVIHGAVLLALALIPLYFTDVIDLNQFTQTLLAPPPPPPPPPAPVVAQARPRTIPKRVLSPGGKLTAPTVIPRTVAMLHEEPLPPDDGLSALGGVPGGIPGGQAGGVLGSILSSRQTTAPPPPRASGNRAPLRVGGRVKRPQPIFTPQPDYPVLAMQSLVEGDVIIDAVIGTDGNVVEI
jgi:protein TonB